METKKILVTGGAGFIGSNICLALQDMGHEVIALDNFFCGVKKNLLEFEGRILEADIRTFEFKEKFDVIIHEAAITDTTVKDRNLMMNINFKPFVKIVKHALKNNVDVIYASSASVYGRGAIPMKEDQEKDILSCYAESKWGLDKLLEKKKEEFEKRGLRFVGLRYFNVYGNREEHKKKMASMIFQLYLQMKKGERPRVFKYGEQERDFVYIKDVVKATLLAMKARKNGVYNVGSGKKESFNKIIDELNKNLFTSLEPVYIENPYRHYQNYTLADLTNTKKFLDYDSEWDIKKGIKDYVKILENGMKKW